MNTRQLKTLKAYIKNVAAYFDGRMPMSRDDIDSRIKYILDYIGSWVDVRADHVLRYNLSVLEDFYRGEHAQFWTSNRNAANAIESRCIPEINAILKDDNTNA